MTIYYTNEECDDITIVDVEIVNVDEQKKSENDKVEHDIVGENNVDDAHSNRIKKTTILKLCMLS